MPDIPFSNKYQNEVKKLFIERDRSLSHNF